MLNTALLEKKFEQMGAQVDIELLEDNRWAVRSQGSPTFDVQNDKKRGEVFKIRIGEDSSASIEVLDVQPKDRHMLILVREPAREAPIPRTSVRNLMTRGVQRGETRKIAASKSKFLLGHDERHWFVAAVPESSSASNVRTAKAALQPKEVLEVLGQKRIKTKKRNKRKNKAFKRQGEWFFLPEPNFVPDDKVVILKNEPLIRGGDRNARGGKPHNMEFCHRAGGTQVRVHRNHPQGVTEEQFSRLSEEEQRRPGWQSLVRDPTVYVKGNVSHSDHATIRLDCWHRVVMNTETQARAMANVVFLD